MAEGEWTILLSLGSRICCYSRHARRFAKACGIPRATYFDLAPSTPEPYSMSFLHSAATLPEPTLQPIYRHSRMRCSAHLKDPEYSVIEPSNLCKNETYSAVWRFFLFHAQRNE